MEIGNFLTHHSLRLYGEATGPAVNDGMKMTTDTIKTYPRGEKIFEEEVTFYSPLMRYHTLATVTPEYIHFHNIDNSDYTYLYTINIHTVQVENPAKFKVSFRMPGLLVQTLNLLGKYIIRAKTKASMEKWVHVLKDVTRTNRDAGISFAPERVGIAKSFVGGMEYYNTLASYIEGANFEILIADWWFSPRVFLKRVALETSVSSAKSTPKVLSVKTKKILDVKYRLDLMLQRKAKEGVKIYILIFAPPIDVVSLNPVGIKQYMEELSPNISVNFSPKGEQLQFTHHQKFVVIDRSLAFVGGIDLCIGRYNEPGSSINDQDSYKYPGYDYYNPAIVTPTNETFQKELKSVGDDQYNTDFLVDRSYPRMPWQDAQVCINGQAAKDVAYNFFQRWNAQAKRDLRNDMSIVPEFQISDADFIINIESASDLKAADMNGLSDPYVKIEVLEGDKKLIERRGCDRTRIIMNNLNPTWNSSFYYRRHNTKLPLTINFTVFDWDQGTTDDFLGRYCLTCHNNKFPPNTQEVYLLKKRNNDKEKGKLKFSITAHPKPMEIRSDFQWEYLADDGWKGYDLEATQKIEKAWRNNETKCLLEHGIFAKDPLEVHLTRELLSQKKVKTGNVRRVRRNPPVLYEGDKVHCQVIRSTDHWSTAGILESSILEEYKKAIFGAKYFIYIESQFFISDTSSSSITPVFNPVSSLLIERITKAYHNKEYFKVYVIVPLHPEGSPTVDTTQAVMYWQYKTISRTAPLSTKKCFFARLEENCPGITIEHYITFFSLFTHGKINGQFVGNQIYVHSKILVVDDEIMIVGSQNINDRSLLGSRDSEIAVKIFDCEEKVPVKFSGKETQVSKFIRDFRMRLWIEHLQVDVSDPENKETRTILSNFKDPTNYQCYVKLWRDRAKNNTLIYDEVFPSKPQDKHKNLKDFNANAPPVNTEKLKDISGHIIMFPMDFLLNVSLKHAVVPDIMFV